jgi:3-oxoacyl-[acyl-carrier protein] reductase
LRDPGGGRNRTLQADDGRAHRLYALENPDKRFVQPAEIAALVAWLCSEECGFSIGGAFDISGGRATY